MDFHFFSISGLLVSAVYFFAGFIDSVCGGGGLVTVPALIAIGIPAHMISGTNQASTIIGSFSALHLYIRNKKLHLFSALCALPFSTIGAYFGSNLNMILPEKSLQIIMLALVPILAVILVFKKDFGGDNHIDELSKRQITVRAVIIGFLLGLYQGFYGPGSGMLALFAFVFLLKLDMLRSNGTIKFVISASCIIASINYALSGMIIMKIVILATIFNTVGSRLGVKYALARGSKGIRPIMFMVIAGLMVKIVMDLI